jgi:hypothetical protein
MEMEKQQIRHFLEVEVSQDGKTILITAEFTDGTSSVLEVPYTHAEWLAKAVFSVAHQALERQVQSGQVQPSSIDNLDVLAIDRIRILGKPRDGKGMIEATGSWLSNGAPGMSFLLVDIAQAKAFAEELDQLVQVAPQLSRPS